MKMSEVFALPMARRSNEMLDSYGELICDYPNEVFAESAVNAINHADALADALENAIETLELYGAHDDPYYRIAIDELKKYRGCSDE